MARIIVCGGNGAGKSTLGKALALALGYRFADIEDYYFDKENTEYDYAAARTKEDVTAMLLEDVKCCGDFVFAAVRGNYGTHVEELLTHAVFINVPKETRMRRVRERSYRKFGNRMLPDGDLYEKEEKFFAMVERRSDDDVAEWLNRLDIPTIKVDGTQPVEKSVAEIKVWLAAMESPEEK